MELGKIFDPTCFLWGVLPALVGVASVAASLYCLFRSGRWMHFFLTPVCIGTALYGLTILYNVFIRGAWPTFIAHFSILIAAVCAFLQIFLFRARIGRGVSP